jgi:HSP20 family protein
MNAGRCGRSSHSPLVIPLMIPRSACKKMAQRWDPIRDLVSLQDRMNRLFQEATEQRRAGDEEAADQEIERADWIPLADVYQTETEYLVAVDLPGIDRAALDISLDDDKLVIRGERPPESEAQHRVERPQGRFLRKFSVPPTVNQEAIAAEYKDGVLRVRLPKRKEQKARRVEIKVH